MKPVNLIPHTAERISGRHMVSDWDIGLDSERERERTLALAAEDIARDVVRRVVEKFIEAERRPAEECMTLLTIDVLVIRQKDMEEALLEAFRQGVYDGQGRRRP